VYGESSGWHIFLNPRGRDISPKRFDPFAVTLDEYKNPPAHLMSRLRLALLVHGVDASGRLSGFTSIAHSPEDVAHTAAALRESIRMLRTEGEL
jgi:glutamate-1-semialdehyde 2,1-aminomutase